MIDVILKRFESPDEIRVFGKGRLEYLSLHFLGADHYAK
jgi:hypothetical protein